jgi:hypothetical protein
MASDDAPRAYMFQNVAFRSAKELYEAVEKARLAGLRPGGAPYWRLFQVVQQDDLVKLKCGLCGSLLSVSNVARIAKTHFKDKFSTCVGMVGAAPRGVKRKDCSSPEATTSCEASNSIPDPHVLDLTQAARETKRTKQSVADFLLPAATATKALEHLYMFFFRNPTVALSHIEDRDLKAAFAIMGITLPTRPTLSTTILDKVYAEVRASVYAPLPVPTHARAPCVNLACLLGV